MFGFLRRRRSGKGRGGGKRPDMGSDLSQPPAADQPAADQLTTRQLFFASGAGSMLPTEDSSCAIDGYGALKKTKTESNLSLSLEGNDDIPLNNNVLKDSNTSESPIIGNCVISDGSDPANEKGEGKSVTADVGEECPEGAKTRAVASREEYSPGSVPASEGPSRDMQCVRSKSEGGLEDLYKGELLFKGREEESEDEEKVVKNDSGCWEGGESRPCSILSRVGTSPREKKHVKWADIDGQSELTRSQEDVRCLAEPESSEEESSGEESSEESSSEEEEVKPQDAGEEDSSSEEGKEPISPDAGGTGVESSSEEEDEDQPEEAGGEDSSTEEDEDKVEVEARPEEADREDSSSDEEADSSGDEEGPTVEGSEVSQAADNGHSDTSEEEDSSEEESSEEEPVKNEEPPAIRIDVAELQKRISELQTDIENKTTNIGRLQIELDVACSESEKVRLRFQRLEEDLESYRQTNKALAEQLQITEHLEEEKVSRSNRLLNDAEKRIRELESELERVKLDYSQLQTSFKKLQADRDMEVQIIQKALEKALTDQEEMEAKYEKEFENLRTLNSGREVQMLEDFEWKLREVERNCKKKIQEYETEYEQKNVILASQLAAAQADLDQISHLKLCEVELNQLKQTSSEQRKNLRSVSRKLEELQVSEKILQEEVNSLRSSLDKEKAHIVALQTMHKEELEEKDRKTKLKMEIQIRQFTHEWEERLRKESYKIKTDLEKTFREEKKAAVDTANRLKDQEISQLKQNWEKKGQELKDEILKLKNKITEIETLHKNDLSNAQTNADRDAFDLRRKMDKLDMSYQEKIEKLQESHENELATLKEDYEKRLQQSEVSMQMQIGNSRTTLELVKQQLRNEAQTKLENLEKQYQQRLEQQWTVFQAEKEASLAQQEEKHKNTLETIYKEIEKTKKQARNEHESLAKRRHQASNQSARCNNVEETNRIQDNDKNHSHSLISTRLDVAEVEEEIRTQGKEEVLQRCIEQLTKQLNAGKLEIEKLRQQLEARDARTHQNNQQQHGQQQRNNMQQPVPNPRRNRKGRGGDCYVQ